MLNLQAALSQDLPAFFLTLSLVAFFVVLAELLTRKFSVSTLVVRKVIHLGMGVIVFFVPDYFQSNFYPVLAALLFLLLNALNLSSGLFRSLRADERQSDGTVVVKSYGSLLFPLVFLLLSLFLWESHKWILQTSMLVMGVGDSLAALIGSSVGKKHIEHLTESPKTVEGSLTMFFSGFLLLLVCLMMFRPEMSPALAAKPFIVIVALALLLALVAAAVEALLSRGLDNFYIPIAVAYVLYVLDMNTWIIPESFLMGGFFAFLLALFSIKVKFLDNSGATATFLLGTTIFGIGGLQWTIPLLTFYLLSSVLSKLGKKRKAKFDLVFEKGSQRDAGQVYANGGIAWILMIIYSLNSDPAVYFAYLGTLAAVQADTWATEIGTMWPDPKAWLITTFKSVPVGTSGGVSVPGTSGAFLGSLFICASAMLYDAHWIFEFGIAQSLLLIGFSGLLASLVDSFFGATVQAQYYDPIREKVTERTHSYAGDGSLVENRLIKGVPFVNNDLVNTFCAVSGSLLAYAVISYLKIFQ
ncbi:MAG: DUF92 domain-containing protein [Chlorobiaceae bacterium]|jgi:uncharacterized protein (TIGR00297 family)|nr:DUF92 domain-containing protein [Chlorobiaceae bacterium]